MNSREALHILYTRISWNFVEPLSVLLDELKSHFNVRCAGYTDLTIFRCFLEIISTPSHWTFSVMSFKVLGIRYATICTD